MISFFFSSRRRHTRLQGDWSSDVCSSDLSLSKTVAPALRIGWMLADAQLLRRCTIAKQTADLCTSPLAQMIAAHYLRSDRKSTRLNSSHLVISYAVFCLKKKNYHL